MRKQKKPERNFLDDFIGLPAGNTNASFYTASLVDGILRFLKINDVTHPDGRHFTSTTFFGYLAEKQPDLLNQLKSSLTKWVLQLWKGGDLLEQVKGFLAHQLAQDSKCGFRLNTSKTQAFFGRANQANSCINTVSSIELPGDIPVVVNTIHSVKGETHTATLYLETFNDGYDVSRILPCFHPNARREKPNNSQKRALKMAYVAMSRPTHLLCVAIHKNTLGKSKKQVNHSVDELQEQFGEYWRVLDVADRRS